MCIRDSTNPAVDDASIVVGEGPTGPEWTLSRPLNSFAGHEALLNNTLYYWRMRARDTWNDSSAWSTNRLWFKFGTPPPNIMQARATGSHSLRLTWEPTGVAVYIDRAPDLSGTQWVEIAGPFTDTQAVIPIPTNLPAGFFRTRTEK